MPKRKKILIYIVIFILTAFIALFIYYNRAKIGKVITPFVMAIIIAYLLNPLVMKLRRRNIPCGASILLIYAFFMLFISSIVLFIVPELVENTRELMDVLPDITTRYQSMINELFITIQASNWSPEIKNTVFREMQNGTVLVQDYILDTMKRALSTMVQTVTTLMDVILALIISYYFIKDAAFFREAVLSLVPRRWRNGLIGTGREVNSILSNFIQGQMLTALIIGVLETIGLMIVGVKYPLILGLIGGTANIIPYFGPILGAIPAIAVALLESPVKALWTVIVFVIVQQVDNAFISPKIIEGRLGLHPVTTILAVLIGSEFFGIIGMLVSVPVMAIVKAVIKRGIEAIV